MKKILPTFCSILLLVLAVEAQEYLFVIEKISVEGNKKTKASVISENLPYGIGDTLSEAEIFAGVNYLQKTGFFNKVTLQPRPGSEPGKLHLIYKVQERYWPALRFKGGFSELSGWYLTPISLNMDNIFGLGNYTSLNFTIGDRITRLGFDYINPNIFDTDLDFHFSINIRSQEFIYYLNDIEFKHAVPQAGYFLGFRSRSGFFKRFLFG